MMKTIIKHGKYSGLETVCTECGCVFGFYKVDVYRDKSSGKEYTDCPECGKKLRVVCQDDAVQR